ncbi:MAG: succinate dehydrogenase assembly factor 2 [Alphaproteobacteria bacterium]|nr:succinate dehydrogenase assembly factor 2 [Alphaproteobacteria bacterium]MDD9919205.1 succinate dehydrogenase assembly factor 2 [Alphaproteobacteria bacterium]
MTLENKPDLHLLKREIKYRSRRSLKEMDDLIGGFVEARLDSLDAAMLTELRDMLEEMDQDLLASWRGEIDIPTEYQRIFDALRAFRQN